LLSLRDLETKWMGSIDVLTDIVKALELS